MIELGDIFREMGSESWAGLATNTSLDEVRIARYEVGVYEVFRGSEIYTQGELRSLIRDGHIQKIGNAENNAHVIISGSLQGMDLETTRSVYESVDDGDMPVAIGEDTIFWDTHNYEAMEIDTIGWEDENLADELIRFENGVVEPYTKLAQAMKEGIWVIMSPVKEEEELP